MSVSEKISEPEGLVILGVKARSGPILAPMPLLSFGSASWIYKDWQYIDVDDDKRHNHFALQGAQLIPLDYSGFRMMDYLAFCRMVDLGFPTRADLAATSDYSLPCCSPLNSTDIERIWLWRQVHNPIAAE